MSPTWQHVEILTPAVCWARLRSVRVGRVGLWDDLHGPQVLPVNHGVVGETVVFRTDLYSRLAEGTRGSRVAFEADELDDRLDSGWSVLLVGHAEHVEDRADAADLYARLGEPWVPGGRPLIARILPLQVTGRRFHR